MARRKVEIAKVRVAESTTLVQFFVVSFSEGFTAVVAFDMELIGLTLEAFPLLCAFLADETHHLCLMRIRVS